MSDACAESPNLLQRTFLHLKGIGPSREHRLWKQGFQSWHSYLAHLQDQARSRDAAVCEGLSASIWSYDNHMWSFFDERLSSKDKWRAFDALGNRAAYVDIETEGTGRPEHITMIGVYAQGEFNAFVRGRNLREAQDMLEQYPLWVTFNGACFDVPAIRGRFPYMEMNAVHIDLRFALRTLGFSGGLKRIEKCLGISRSAETDGLDGWDAVRLWHQHMRGDREALELLVQYNEEDVRNLEPLMYIAFDKLGSKLSG